MRARMTTAQQLDPPWPGDETESEYQARRRKLLAELSDDQIRDMVCDALDYTMIDTIRRFAVLCDQPRTGEHIAVGGAMIDRVAMKVEAYLEANE